MDVGDALKNASIKISKKVVPDIAQSEEQKEAKEETQVGNDLMVSFFRLNPVDVNQETNRKLGFIYNWADSRAKSEQELINVLRDVKYRLGAPNPGVSHIDHIYNYLKLRSIAEQSELKAKAMET